MASAFRRKPRHKSANEKNSITDGGHYGRRYCFSVRHSSAEARTPGGTPRGEARRNAQPGADRSRYAGGRATGQVMNDDGAIEEREVRVGVVSRVAAEIVSGLEPGEKVVTGTATGAPQNRPRTATANAPRMSPRI